MVLLRHGVLLTLAWTFTFNELFGVLHAEFRCPKGQKVHPRGNGCEECDDYSYSPTENKSRFCRPCTKCLAESGSKAESECQKTSDTICQCRPGFVPRLPDFSICKCNIGSGLTKKGNLLECHECEHGFFSDKMDSPCKKWNECRETGVKVNGTKTSDATCNGSVARRTSVAALSTSTKSPSLTTHVATNAPETTATTPKLHLRDDTAPTVPAPATGRPSTPKQPDDSIGMTLLLAFGIVGLLILMTLTCKLNIVHCIQSYKEPAELVNAQDSLWGSPVEESGDSSPSSLAKLNPEP